MPAPFSELPLAVADHGSVTVVTFSDRRLAAEERVQLMDQQLTHLIQTDGRRQLLLDLSHVEYFSSMAFGKLIQLHRQLQTLGGRLALCNVDPWIPCLAPRGGSSFFEVFPNQAAALQAMTSD